MSKEYIVSIYGVEPDGKDIVYHCKAVATYNVKQARCIGSKHFHRVHPKALIRTVTITPEEYVYEAWCDEIDGTTQDSDPCNGCDMASPKPDNQVSATPPLIDEEKEREAARVALASGLISEEAYTSRMAASFKRMSADANLDPFIKAVLKHVAISNNISVEDLKEGYSQAAREQVALKAAMHVHIEADKVDWIGRLPKMRPEPRPPHVEKMIKNALAKRKPEPSKVVWHSVIDWGDSKKTRMGSKNIGTEDNPIYCPVCEDVPSEPKAGSVPGMMFAPKHCIHRRGQKCAHVLHRKWLSLARSRCILFEDWNSGALVCPHKAPAMSSGMYLAQKNPHWSGGFSAVLKEVRSDKPWVKPGDEAWERYMSVVSFKKKIDKAVADKQAADIKRLKAELAALKDNIDKMHRPIKFKGCLSEETLEELSKQPGVIVKGTPEIKTSHKISDIANDIICYWKKNHARPEFNLMSAEEEKAHKLRQRMSLGDEVEACCEGEVCEIITIADGEQNGCCRVAVRNISHPLCVCNSHPVTNAKPDGNLLYSTDLKLIKKGNPVDMVFRSIGCVKKESDDEL